MRFFTFCILFTAALVQANDFVVQTEVSSTTTGISEAARITIFTGDLVYDYAVDAPGQVTVFDFHEECIWKIDAPHRIQYQLPFETLSRLVEEASLRAIRLTPTVRFAAEPTYTGRQWDPQTRRVQLTHELISYEAQLSESSDPDQAARYRDFADWSARLNTLAPGLPPNARLELNREIFMRESVPVHVDCQRKTPQGERIQLSSDHQFRPQLTPAETQQVAQIRQWQREFAREPWQR